MKKLKTIFFILLTVQISMYLLLGDLMLENEILTEFKEFSKRRLANKYNVENNEVYEQFVFSSCGDEFFRDEEKLEEIINNTNLNRYSKLYEMEKSGEIIMMSEDDDDFNPILIKNLDYYRETSLYERVGKNEEINVIEFNVCRTNKIPFISTKIISEEIFTTNTDFHSMMYTGQMVNFEIKYVWVLFKWIRISKEFKDYP